MTLSHDLLYIESGTVLLKHRSPNFITKSYRIVTRNLDLETKDRAVLGQTRQGRGRSGRALAAITGAHPAHVECCACDVPQ